MTLFISIVSALLVLLFVFGALVYRELKKKNALIWLGSYLRRKIPAINSGPVHVMFCFVDHFEPGWGRPSYEVEVDRVEQWRSRYPAMAKKFKDADGCHPKHSFFYPEEEYRPEHLAALAEICDKGFGEIEVHLHHDNDTADGLREKINRFVKTLHETHGALPLSPATGRPVFGFIHGNWCLDNSRSDGRWCGVNNELDVLEELGCYADFTLPSAPSDTQTAMINSIYYAIDDPCHPKSHNTGIPAAVNSPQKKGLLLIQGALCMNWGSRKWGLIPRIENSDIRRSNPPTAERVRLWIKQHIHVAGQPNWVFVKIHTHGTQDGDLDMLLSDKVERMHQVLTTEFNDGTRHSLHYVSAREMFNIAKAAEAGKTGNPNDYRDFILARPEYIVPARHVAA